jgi:hypothetical protein
MVFFVFGRSGTMATSSALGVLIAAKRTQRELKVTIED